MKKKKEKAINVHYKLLKSDGTSLKISLSSENHHETKESAKRHSGEA